MTTRYAIRRIEDLHAINPEVDGLLRNLAGEIESARLAIAMRARTQYRRDDSNRGDYGGVRGRHRGPSDEPHAIEDLTNETENFTTIMKIRAGPVAKEYVEERSGGQYIVGTRVSLASVVVQFQQGASPETILQNFPSLASLENVYGAIAYYLANQPAVEQYLKALLSG